MVSIIDSKILERHRLSQFDMTPLVCDLRAPNKYSIHFSQSESRLGKGIRLRMR